MEQEAAGNHAFFTAQCWGSSLGGIWILWFMARCWQTQLHWHWNSRKDINKDINQPRLTKKTYIVFTLGPRFREDPWLVTGGLKNNKNGRFEKIHLPTFGVEFTIHNQYEPLIHGWSNNPWRITSITPSWTILFGYPNCSPAWPPASPVVAHGHFS